MVILFIVLWILPTILWCIGEEVKLPNCVFHFSIFSAMIAFQQSSLKLFSLIGEWNRIKHRTCINLTLSADNDNHVKDWHFLILRKHYFLDTCRWKNNSFEINFFSRRHKIWIKLNYTAEVIHTWPINYQMSGVMISNPTCIFQRLVGRVMAIIRDLM